MNTKPLPGLYQKGECTGYKVNGRWVTEEEFTKDSKGIEGMGPMATSSSIKTWPMKSDGAGVHPDDAEKAHQESIRNGVPTEFTKDGRAVFTSLRHQRAYLKSVGLHNNDDNA
jgi:hypothetical protein